MPPAAAHIYNLFVTMFGLQFIAQFEHGGQQADQRTIIRMPAGIRFDGERITHRDALRHLRLLLGDQALRHERLQKTGGSWFKEMRGNFAPRYFGDDLIPNFDLALCVEMQSAGAITHNM